MLERRIPNKMTLYSPQDMTTHYVTIEDVVHKNKYCPIDIGIFPNKMGINLCSVEGVSWMKQPDGQLVTINIYFKPAPSTFDKQTGEWTIEH